MQRRYYRSGHSRATVASLPHRSWLTGMFMSVSHEGTLYALHASTGAMVWSTSLGKKLFEPDEENAMLMTGLPPPMVCSSDPRNTRFLRMRRPHHLLRF